MGIVVLLLGFLLEDGNAETRWDRPQKLHTPCYYYIVWVGCEILRCVGAEFCTLPCLQLRTFLCAETASLPSNKDAHC
jgi:hypothetical protein